jgi:peroxiredoxin
MTAMIKTRCLVLGLLAMVALAPAAWAEPAPAMKLTTLKGEPLHLADLKGKVVLLNFFASWCAPCHKEAPDMVKLQAKLGPKGLTIIGLAVGSERAEVEKFIAKYGLNYPVALYGDKEMEAYGGVRAVPTTVFVDRRGHLAGGVEGAVPMSTLEKKILELLES